MKWLIILLMILMSATPVLAGSTSTGNIASTGGTGYARKAEATWNDTRQATTATGYSAAIRFNWRYTGSAYEVSRGFLAFNTASLADDAEIDSVKVKMYVSSKTDPTGNIPLYFDEGTQGSAIDNGDIDAFSGWRAAASPYYPADYAASTMYTNHFVASDTTSVKLNSSGISHINKTGVTYFAIYYGKDKDNVTPPGINDDRIDIGVAFLEVWVASSWSGKVNGVESPASVNGVTDIKSVNGVE